MFFNTFETRLNIWTDLFTLQADKFTSTCLVSFQFLDDAVFSNSAGVVVIATFSLSFPLRNIQTIPPNLELGVTFLIFCFLPREDLTVTCQESTNPVTNLFSETPLTTTNTQLVVARADTSTDTVVIDAEHSHRLAIKFVGDFEFFTFFLSYRKCNCFVLYAILVRLQQLGRPRQQSATDVTQNATNQTGVPIRTTSFFRTRFHRSTCFVFQDTEFQSQVGINRSIFELFWDRNQQTLRDFFTQLDSLQPVIVHTINTTIIGTTFFQETKQFNVRQWE
ncbi:hypothetical protein D3C72_1395760 [compost metagenome]